MIFFHCQTDGAAKTYPSHENKNSVYLYIHLRKKLQNFINNLKLFLTHGKDEKSLIQSK